MALGTINWGYDMSDLSLPAQSVAAQNAHGYLISSSGVIHTFNSPNSWSTIYCPFTQPAKFLHAGYDGSMMAILDNNTAFLSNHHGWNQIATGVFCAAVGDNNNYVLCEDDYTVKVINGSTTNTIYAPYTLKQLSTTVSNSHIWALDVNGYVHEWKGSAWMWESKGTKQMNKIHVSLSSSSSLQVCGVDIYGAGWRFNFTLNDWESVSSPESGVSFSTLEAGNNYIWGTLSNGRVYRGSF